MGPNQLKCNQVGCSSIPVGYNFSHMWCVGNLSRVYTNNRQVMGPNPLKCNQVGCSSIPVGYNFSHMWCVRILSRVYKDGRHVMGPNQLSAIKWVGSCSSIPKNLYERNGILTLVCALYNAITKTFLGHHNVPPEIITKLNTFLCVQKPPKSGFVQLYTNETGPLPLCTFLVMGLRMRSLIFSESSPVRSKSCIINELSGFPNSVPIVRCSYASSSWHGHTGHANCICFVGKH